MTAGREGQTFAGQGAFLRHVNLVKLPHTVFALPFAIVGVILASRTAPLSVEQVAWVVLAFTSARFAAMGFNRIVDREIDARNPRTRTREIPAGVMSVREAAIAVTVASLLFIIAAWRLNPLCLVLAPVALAWVFFYSYTKRFTRWSHLVLGFGLAIAPVGGYLAVTGAWSSPWWMLMALALAVAGWVGGFDILYSLQDESFDKENDLHSVPVAFGASRAIMVARLLHLITAAGLALAGIAVGAGTLYFAGVAVAASLLFYEHTLVRADDISRMNAAFFTMNGIISITFSLFVLADRVIR